MTEEQEMFEVRDRRPGDWFWVNRAIIHSDLTAATKLVYCALASFANDRSQMFPSITRIAELTSTTRQTVISSLQSLEALTLIQCLKKPGKVTRYTLLKVTSQKFVLVKNKHRTSINKAHELEILNYDKSSLYTGEVSKIAEKFGLDEKTVLLEEEKAQDWLASSGKRYKDYPAFFRNWLRRVVEARSKGKKFQLENVGKYEHLG